MTYQGKKHYEREMLAALISDSTSKHEVIKALGLPTKGTYGYRVLNYFIETYGIDCSHFRGRHVSAEKITIPLEDIFSGQHPNYKAGDLKKRLIKNGLMLNECAICKLTEWLEKPIPLELDHINGKSWDHRLENLRILCRNCHGQTDTFAGRNRKKSTLTDEERVLRRRGWQNTRNAKLREQKRLDRATGVEPVL